MLHRTHEYNGWKLEALDTRENGGWRRILVAWPPESHQWIVPYLFVIALFPNPDPSSEFGSRGMIHVCDFDEPGEWEVPSAELMQQFVGDGYLELFFDIIARDNDDELPDDMADYLRGLL